MSHSQGLPLDQLVGFPDEYVAKLAALNVHSAEGFLSLAANPLTSVPLADYLAVDGAALEELARVAGEALPDDVRRRMSEPADTSRFGLGALTPDDEAHDE